MKARLVCSTFLAAALLAPAALADPPQHDAISIAGEPGSPAVNGCPASSIAFDYRTTSYGAPRLADANGDFIVCAIPLPDAARDAHYGSLFDGRAFYDFVDNHAGNYRP